MKNVTSMLLRITAYLAYMICSVVSRCLNACSLAAWPSRVSISLARGTLLVDDDDDDDDNGADATETNE